jgi:hypothetical protein
MSEAADPALSDAEAWVDALFTQRRGALAQVDAQERQLARLGIRTVSPTTAEIRRWWRDNHGCCPYCGRDLMGRA